MSNLIDNLPNLVEGVVTFNAISGNLLDVNSSSLLAQSKVVLEEATELLEAVEEGLGQEQILKEAADCMVSICGMVAMLNRLGYDVSGAWQAVNENNMTKFPTDRIEAIYAADAIANETGKVCSVFERDGRYVIKDGNGKIRKSASYSKVSVLQYTPDYQQKENTND